MRFETRKKDPMFGGLNQASETDGTPVSTGSNLRANITYVLVATWVIIILGQAFGWISPDYRPDAVLVASVGVILAYFFEQKIVQTSK